MSPAGHGNIQVHLFNVLQFFLLFNPSNYNDDLFGLADAPVQWMLMPLYSFSCFLDFS